MRIGHLSDTHLGHLGSARQRLLENVWRQGPMIGACEFDIMAAFENAIGRLIERAPDLVLHTGDLFDSARPAPQVLDFAMRQVKRLGAHGIPFVVVEGNHSAPRDRAQGSPLELLAHLPLVEVVCGDARTVSYDDARIQAIPHRAVSRAHGLSREAIVPDHINVMAAHGVADGLGVFRSGRRAQDLPVASRAAWFEYVGLGHCHRYGQVPETECAFYPGSTAMVTWGDFRAGHRFGFLEVTAFAGQPSAIERVELDSRRMHAYGLDTAEGLSAKEILQFLEAQVQALPTTDAACNVVIEGMDPLARRQMSRREIEDLFVGAAILRIETRVREQHWEQVHAGLTTGGTLEARFVELVRQTDGDARFKADVLALGESLLDRAARQVETEDLRDIGESEESPEPLANVADSEPIGG